jgi:hypothetical protein
MMKGNISNKGLFYFKYIALLEKNISWKRCIDYNNDNLVKIS